MLTAVLIIVAAILLTFGIVWLIDKFIPTKIKPVLLIVFWLLIAFLGYNTFMSVYEPIQFNKIKEKRYKSVISKLIDIRDAQLAHRDIRGKYTNNFDSLVKFIEYGRYTITQQRDSSVLDEEMTKRYGGVEMYKEITVIDTLGYVKVKDSLFKDSDRYKTMINVPEGKEGAKFTINAGVIGEDGKRKMQVFEAFVKKSDILYDQSKDLITQENQVVSVDGVNGDALRVGSMNEVKTVGNWPKTYGDNE